MGQRLKFTCCRSMLEVRLRRMQAETAIRKVIGKAFRNVDTLERSWNKTVEDSADNVGSLCNLCEQLQSCKQVNIEGTPLRDFPDIKDRLQYKLIYSLDIVIARLRETLDKLEEIRKGVCNQCRRCMETYQRHADQLGLDRTLERSATEPSLADMLEWLHDIDRAFTQQFTKRKLLLDLLRCDNQEYVETLSKQWKDSGNLNEIIGSAQAHVSFFLADVEDTS